MIFWCLLKELFFEGSLRGLVCVEFFFRCFVHLSLGFGCHDSCFNFLGIFTLAESLDSLLLALEVYLDQLHHVFGLEGQISAVVLYCVLEEDTFFHLLGESGFQIKYARFYLKHLVRDQIFEFFGVVSVRFEFVTICFSLRFDLVLFDDCYLLLQPP